MQGKQLAHERRRHGLSQRDLAMRLGTTQSVISALETGRRPVTLAMQARVEHAFSTGKRPSEALATLRGPLRQLLHSLGFQQPRLFGSCARGSDHAHSDIDIAAEFPPRTTFIDLAAAQEKLTELMGFEVQLVDLSEFASAYPQVHQESVPL